ncbi:melatonin receptor type 1A-like [Actinia tenebrosa]|uniref:Melatonin receptor type 1A-like n=1 Tax=Actinia tenebrosa TaxID=6105 RepID=A0A6P8HNJ8_ACTTE|nr:melatonin receptor type 1A-like [Actinia tenebrosa]XP_031556588.1 melatonin receptor type 1A-like [Actinia tenebrosa]
MNNETSCTSLNRGWTEFMSRTPATIAVETSILLLIGLVAIGGNLLVVLSIYRNPSLRTITNYFVLSLAVSDILYPVSVISITVVASIRGRSSVGSHVCGFQAIFSSSLVVVSVNTITLMAINRFVRVCKPQKYKKIFHRKTSITMIGAVWIASFTGMTLINSMGVSVYSRLSPYKIMCVFAYYDNKKPRIIISNLPHVFCLFLPFTIIVYCYFKVFKKIREHKRNVAPSNQGRLGTSVQEIKVTWVLFTMLVGYCLTWVLVLGVLLASSISCRYEYQLPREIHMIVTYGIASGSILNPIIYGVFNMAFRLEYKRILIQWYSCT